MHELVEQIRLSSYHGAQCNISWPFLIVWVMIPHIPVSPTFFLPLVFLSLSLSLLVLPPGMSIWEGVSACQDPLKVLKTDLAKFWQTHLLLIHSSTSCTSKDSSSPAYCQIVIAIKVVTSSGWVVFLWSFSSYLPSSLSAGNPAAHLLSTTFQLKE